MLDNCRYRCRLQEQTGAKRDVGYDELDGTARTHPNTHCGRFPRRKTVPIGRKPRSDKFAKEGDQDEHAQEPRNGGCYAQFQVHANRGEELRGQGSLR